MKNRSCLFLLFCLIFTSCKTKSVISVPTPKDIVYFLASDSLQGRFPGTEGCNEAAAYIAQNFKNAGLIPLDMKVDSLLNSSYFLPFWAQTPKTNYKTQNVAGFIRGTDPKLSKEIIVIGAHYDHLGMGGVGSPSRKPDTLAIHNGADDNASGCASVISLAYKFSKHPTKRSLLFITFGAEEMGLIGSKAFTKDMNKYLFGQDSVYYMAMINVDMIGHLRNGWFSIDGIGTSPESPSLVKHLVDSLDLHITSGSSGYGPSDHTSFYIKNIPVFFVHTPATEDYHTPFDDADKLYYPGMDSVILVLHKLVENLGNRPDRLRFTNTEDKMKSGRSHSKLKVKLGLMPDVTGACEEGMIADIVVKGKPAYEGGLRNGDIILSINNRPVKDVYVYMDILNTLEIGQLITIKVRRGKEDLIFSVLPKENKSNK